MPEFCHLHCHTQYSLLDGAARIKRMFTQAKRMDLPALAITDHGNLYGVPEFYTTGKKMGVQPIIGCEFYVTPGGIHDKQDRTRYHQVLLAKNHRGYKNLMKLSSTSFVEGFYYKPRIDRDLLREHSTGLIATTCCLQGEVLQTILKKGEKAARPIFEDYLNIFGDDYYIEIQNHDIDDQRTCNQVLLRWAKEYDVEIIATNDVHYVEQQDAEAQDVLLCLQTGKDYNDPNRMRFENDQFFLKNTGQMQRALSTLDPMVRDRALNTTRAVADKCKFELPMGDLLMPHYPIPDEFGDDTDAYLRHLTFKRAKDRYGEVTQEVAERLNHELSIISEMGYAGYFLIVQDFTDAARELDVRVGPGRGSAAGSCVSYCLGITNVDPLQYDLLFERFLNPERVSMPDIDIDFDDRGRSKVIDYVVEKYGRENVCQIITFGTMGARSVIRDVARVLDISLSRADEIAKMIPDGPGVDLDDAFDQVPEFRALKQSDDDATRDLMRYAQVLEGSARHTGVHAAGVIIAPGNVSDYVPISVAKSKGEKVITTQYDGDWVEKFGLLKMDFLGLKTLTVIEDAIDLIEQHRGITIDPEDIPLEDGETYRLFQRGDTVSIFQFESTGMREWLRKLKPTHINDLIAMNALYRPGPMQFIPNYIDRKHGREEVSYPHSMLEPVLESTYGIPVFQEQVMEMARVMGGYSLGQADILRRAMGKKKKKVMDEQRAIFLKGARERDVDDETASEVFDMMAEFAGYGFNKSHSAAYSIVAYQTAYLKAHYPPEFMAAAMTNDMSNNDKLATVLEEARKMGIELLRPSIMRSQTRFSVDEGQIRMGLGAIKGVGESAIDALMEARDKFDALSSIFELTKELDLRRAGKRTLESLARAGAFDEIDGHRAQVLEAVESASKYGQKVQANRAAGQNSLFGEAGASSSEMQPNLPDVEQWSTSRKLKEERDVIGFYVSGHPLENYQAEAEAFADAHLNEIERFETEAPEKSNGYGRNRGPTYTFCGIITEINRHTTKSGKPIAFGSIEDRTGEGEIVCFSSVLDRVQNYLNVDDVVLAQGSVEVRGGTVKIIVNDIIPMWKVRDQMVESLSINLDPDLFEVQDIKALRHLCDRHQGHARLYFDVDIPGFTASQRVRSRTTMIDPSSEFLKGARQIFGAESLRLEGAKE